MSTLTIRSDPAAPGGGHAIIDVPYSGRAPVGDVSLKIQHIARKQWLTAASDAAGTKGGWNNADGSITVPAANVVLVSGTLSVKLGPDIVNHFGRRDGLHVEIDTGAAKLAGNVRPPEDVRPSTETMGKARVFEGQTESRSSGTDDLIRKDLGMRQDGDANRAAIVEPIARTAPRRPEPRVEEQPIAPVPPLRQPVPEQREAVPTPPKPLKKTPSYALIGAMAALVLITAGGAGAWYYGLFPPFTSTSADGPAVYNSALKAALERREQAKREFQLSGP